MPGNGPNTSRATVYPPDEQYERWIDHADEFDMTISGFIANMVEAGLKKFDGTVAPDETNRELREQRNDLKAELDATRERVSKLEDQLYRSDAAEIRRFVAENPGASFERITDHLRETVSKRANEHLATMEGDTLEVHNDVWYPAVDPQQEYQR